MARDAEDRFKMILNKKLRMSKRFLAVILILIFIFVVFVSKLQEFNSYLASAPVRNVVEGTDNSFATIRLSYTN